MFQVSIAPSPDLTDVMSFTTKLSVLLECVTSARQKEAQAFKDGGQEIPEWLSATFLKSWEDGFLPRDKKVRHNLLRLLAVVSNVIPVADAKFDSSANNKCQRQWNVHADAGVNLEEPFVCGSPFCISEHTGLFEGHDRATGGDYQGPQF